MYVVSHEVQPLFAEPYFRANIAGAISPAQIEFIQRLKMNGNTWNLMSDNVRIFDEPELKSIKDAVQDVVDLYAREVMGIRQQIYVTESWSLINHINVGMLRHSHPNSVVSGSLYYCPLPEPVAGMIFNRHSGYQLIELEPDRGRGNVYNTPVTRVMPQQNDVLLFSSRLWHVVETNVSDKLRYSIAFNAFVKGTFGGKTTQLTL